MNRPDQAQLFGMIVGALDQDEHQQVKQAVAASETAQADLSQVAATVKFLDLDREHPDYEPPAGLAQRTCAWLELQTAKVAATVHDNLTGSRSVRRALRECQDGCGSRGFSAADMVVAAGIFLAVSMLFFPALANSRRQAHLAACQNNLRHIGLAFANYIEQKGKAPEIPAAGNRSVAGIYAPMLHDNGNGFISDQRTLVCPSSKYGQQPGQWRGVPSLAQLDAAAGDELAEIQKSMGGSYGYNLGYYVNGHYTAPRGMRSGLVLLADSPTSQPHVKGSDNHGPHGQNILFADGHVQHILDCFAGRCDDNLFLNRRQHIAAGVDEDDTVIGRSEVSPFRKP